MRRIRVNKISQEKLENRVKIMVEDAHVLEHSRAQFLHDLCQEISQSSNPLLTPVRSHIRYTKKDSWVIAMQIVSKYLQGLKLDLTKETFDTEVQKDITPTFYTHGILPIKLDENAIIELLKLKNKENESEQEENQANDDPY